MLDRLRRVGFDVIARNHAEAILAHEFAPELQLLTDRLADVRIPVRELIGSGGGEAQSTQRMRRMLVAAGWVKHNFRIETTVDGVPRGDGTSHEIDHILRTDRGTLALEIEWNNKDPFFDRDLENFQRLHGQSVISVGIIVTRGAALQAGMIDAVARYLEEAGICDETELYALGMKQRTERQRLAVEQAVGRGESFAAAFARFFVNDKFGTATTHWSKLAERVARGVGNPCPLLLIGLPAATVIPYSAATPEL